MKIAIVAPCPQPFIVGGAEKLWWGLARYFNEFTDHQADIIKLPSPEANFWELIDSYQRFSSLQLDGFDLVVSGKYPAWMIRHPRHVCYMLHRLRGLYDAYSGPMLQPLGNYPNAIHELLLLMENNRRRRAILPELFERLAVIAYQDNESKAAFDFPGPLSRAVVHFLDDLALDPAHISRFVAIARTVAERTNYFPEGVEVAIAHPPSNLNLIPSENIGSYFLTVSRLDRPKRIDLIIEAMRHVDTDTKLLIAGVGPDEERLRMLATHDPRVKFLGFKSDAELIKLYQNALAVPFVPYQEDYGLVTIEAMMAAKPVITVKDAGGPTELVRHGKNGLVTDPNPIALGRALTQLVTNSELVQNLGINAQKDAEQVNWRTVTDTLLSLPSSQLTFSSAHGIRRRTTEKLVVAVTFPIFPPRHGGQNRVYNLYRHFASQYDVTLVALVDPDSSPSDTEIAPGLREIRIPKSRDSMRYQAKLQSQFTIPVTDIAATQFYHHTPALLDVLRREAADASALIACHPYLFPALAEISNKPIWYEAQDIEFKLKAQLFSSEIGGAELIAQIRKLEEDCCQSAQWIFACSKEDSVVLSEAFSIASEKFIIVPNGTNSNEIRYIDLKSKNNLKKHLGCTKQNFVLFMGSGHHPNIMAVNEIFKIASKLPEVTFLVVGNVCYAFDPTLKPENVWLLGEITETSRRITLELADIALNPMLLGSGTNLKMLDYFAAGIPVIATEVGTRGLNVVDGEHLLIRSAEKMPATIQDLLAQPELAISLTQAARRHVEEYFDWQSIAEQALKALRPE